MSTISTSARVKLGRTDSARDLILDLGDAWHIAIQGQTRSGKSVLTYTLLAKLAKMRHVVIAGCDPTGVLFAPFAGAPRPEWRASGAKDPVKFKDVLQALVNEMDDRIEGMLIRGMDKLSEFEPDTPLIVVVLEEFPGMMRAAKAHDAASGAKASDRIEPAITLAVGRLVSESAKAGIRVVALAQRMSSNVMDTDSRSQFGTRMSLRLEKPEDIKMLHENVTPEMLAAWPTFAPGIGICDITGNRAKFRADFIDYAEYRKRVMEALIEVNAARRASGHLAAHIA